MKNIFKKKLFWKVYGLDVIFVFLTAFIAKFFVSRIYGVIVVMQGLGGLLGGYEGLDQNTITTEQALELNNLVNELNSSLSGLVFNLAIFILIISLLYLIIKSLEWNLIYNGKIENYKKYFGKFFLISLILGILSSSLFYFILVKSRTFLIDYMFNDSFLFGILIQILILVLIYTAILHFAYKMYAYSNKLAFLESIKKIFKIERSFFVLIFIFFISILLVRYGLVLNTSIFNMLFLIALISFIFTWYKFYLTENIS